MINEKNFMNSTKAVFKGCKCPKRKPDFISKSGSKYWFGQNKKGSFVIRKSGHWCSITMKVSDKYEKRHIEHYYSVKKISSCVWHLNSNKNTTGKCYFKNFKQL